MADFIYTVCRGLSKGLITLAYAPKVYGISPKDCPGGALIAPNHASFLDPPLVGACWSEPTYFLARESLFKNPLFGALIRACHSVPVSQGKSNLGVIKAVKRLVNEEKKVLIFPEGTRTETGELMPPKAGVGFIMHQIKCTVIPTYVHGTFKAWGRGRTLPRPFVRLHVVYGRPIRAEEWISNEELKPLDLSQLVMDRIVGLRQWFLDGATGKLPE